MPMWPTDEAISASVGVSDGMFGDVLITRLAVTEIAHVSDEVSVSVRHAEDVLVEHGIGMLVRTLVVAETAALVVRDRVRAEETERLHLVGIRTSLIVRIAGVRCLVHFLSLWVLPLGRWVLRRIERLSMGRTRQRQRNQQRTEGGK